MKTIGKTLHEARIEKKLSIEAVSRQTKIKGEFIAAIEQENWLGLPEFPVALGFIKNIASVVGVDRNQAVALARRDYPPRKFSVYPKEDIGSKFFWSPKFTFFSILTFLTLIVVGYLVFQYIKFSSPPPLDVYKPKEGEIVERLVVEVAGKTDPDATVKTNNQPVLVDQEGVFMAEVEVSESTSSIEVVATSRSGKETKIYRNIRVKLK